MAMDGEMDAVSTRVAGIGMLTGRVGVAVVIVIGEIATAVTVIAVKDVAPVIVVAATAAVVIASKDVSAPIAAIAAAVAEVSVIRGLGANDPARTRRGIVARARGVGMEVGAMEIEATRTEAMGLVMTSVVAKVIAPRVAAMTATGRTVIAGTSIAMGTGMGIATVIGRGIPTVAAATEAAAVKSVVAVMLAVAGKQARLSVRMRLGIVSSTRRCRWPAARKMPA